uniref:Uncharacterized protein n=1 Tax=Romanomermis culicivorax TaxID=13658 RepID=A0A915K8E2_ROMCU
QESGGVGTVAELGRWRCWDTIVGELGWWRSWDDGGVGTVAIFPTYNDERHNHPELYKKIL